MTALLSLFPGPYNEPRRAPGTLYPISPPLFDATVFDVYQCSVPQTLELAASDSQ